MHCQRALISSLCSKSWHAASLYIPDKSLNIGRPASHVIETLASATMSLKIKLLLQFWTTTYFGEDVAEGDNGKVFEVFLNF